MTIEVKYTDDNMGVTFYAVGKVTGKDIIESQRDIYQSNGFKNLRYWIVDRSRCTEYKVSSDEVSQIATMDNKAVELNPNLIMALISESDLQFGVSIMYESQIIEDGFNTNVFRNRSEAEKWIKTN